MEPLSSYKISHVNSEQVRDYVELTELSGINTTPEITEWVFSCTKHLEPRITVVGIIRIFSSFLYFSGSY